MVTGFTKVNILWLYIVVESLCCTPETSSVCQNKNLLNWEKNQAVIRFLIDNSNTKW